MNNQLSRVITHSMRKFLCNAPKANFGLDKTLKDRDEGQEKVYINQMESKIWLMIEETLKKLLNKLEDQEENEVEKGEEFSRRMKQILHRYRVDNVAFAAEVENLHRVLWIPDDIDIEIII